MATQFTMNADMKTFDGTGIAASTGAEIAFALEIPAGEAIRVVESPRAWFLDSHRVVGYIRSDGRMYDRRAVSAAPFDLNDPGNIGVRLIANTDALQVETVSYRASIQHVVDGRTIVHKSWTFTAPSSDITVDLASYA